MVEERVPHHAAERCVEADALAGGPLRLDVLDPAVSGQPEDDVVVAAAVHVEVLETRVVSRGHVPRAELRVVRGIEGYVQRRREPDRVAAHGLYLHHLADGPVRPREPSARWASRR